MPQADDDQPERVESAAKAHRQRPKRKLIRILVLAAIAVLVIAVGITYAVRWVIDANGQVKSNSSLKQIGLAIHTYNDSHGGLPHNTYGPDGKLLLSWRVHILPFIEQDPLYQQFHLDEPWDSPSNIKLLDKMPVIYTRPSDRGTGRETRTYYRGFSNPGAVFERRAAHVWPRNPALTSGLLDLRQISDGTPNTILVVEAGEPVEWTKPDDLDASPGKPLPKLGGMNWRSGRFQALMGDGAPRSYPVNIDDTKLRALISHSGGEAVSPD